MKKVIIHKGEIEICELTKDIAKEMARLGDNPNVFKCVSDSFPNPYTYEKALEFIAKAQEQKIGHIFGIYWKGTFVGNIGLHSQTGLERKSVEIGYFIGEEYWGNGIGTQAVSLMCDYGFQNLDINRIIGSVMDFNIGSMRVLEKCGFKKEGVFKQALIKLGEFHNDYRYGLLK